jgi:hypothetical protein
LSTRTDHLTIATVLDQQNDYVRSKHETFRHPHPILQDLLTA